MSEHVEVAIAGGGMVGATLACALGLQGRRVAVIEPREPALFSPRDDYDLRVSAVSRASQRIFEGLDVWPLLQSRRVSPYEHMHVWDATGRGEIHFDSADLGEPNLGHIIENRVIQDALLERLRALDNVQWLCPNRLQGVEVDENRVSVVLEEGQTFSAELLVGADGSSSKVRELAGIELKAQAYRQKGVVATVSTARAHRATAWQRFLPSGPLAFLPLADGRSSIVWSTREAQADELLSLDDTAFAEALGEAFDYRLGCIESVSARAAFPLKGSQAYPYVRPRIALVGDAAHTVHPLAGQGVNLGLLDAAVLAEVLAESRHNIGSLRVLRRYERARRGDNVLMMRAMEGFSLLFGNTLPPLRWARNLGLSLTDRAPPVKHELMRRAMGLAGELPALARGIHPGQP